MKVHFIGIGGISMSGLAFICLNFRSGGACDCQMRQCRTHWWFAICIVFRSCPNSAHAGFGGYFIYDGLIDSD